MLDFTFLKGLPARSIFVVALLSVISAGHPLSYADEAAEEAATEEEPASRAELIEAALEAAEASEDQLIRAWGLRAYSETSRPDWGRVAGGLDDAQPSVRLAAAEALLWKNQRVTQAQGAVADVFSSEDATTRRQIIEVTLPSVSERQRIAIYRSLLALDDDAAWSQVIQHLARRASGAEHGLVQELATGRDAERGRTAGQAIAAAGRQEGMATLRALVASSDSDQRATALDLARSIGTADARQAIMPLLNGGDELAQRVGAYLAPYGVAEALSLVAALAKNTDASDEARAAALNLLNSERQALFSWDELSEMLEEAGRSAEFQRALWEATGVSNAPEAREHLMRGLDSTFAQDRVLAFHAAGFTGDAALVPMLAQGIAARGAHAIRSAAVVALGRIGGDEAAEILTTNLRVEREPEVRIAFIEALGMSGSAVATQPIIFEFAQRNDDSARAGLVALERIANPEAARQVETVSETWRSTDIRWQAALVLFRLDPRLGRIRILQLLERPVQGFEEDIEELPAELRAEIDDLLLAHSQTDVRESALRRVRAREDGGWAALRSYAAGAPTPDVRRAAIQVVTEQARAEDRELLETLAGSRDRQNRHLAYRALASLEDADLEDFWHSRLEDTDHVVRLIAAWALLRMGLV